MDGDAAIKGGAEDEAGGRPNPNVVKVVRGPRARGGVGRDRDLRTRLRIK